MATVTDKLVVELIAETKGLRNELKRVQGDLKKTEKQTNKVGDALKGLAAVAATIGIVQLASDTVNVIRKFEDLEATLRAVTGSSQGAANAMDLIRDFTKNTTFQVDEVTRAFIILKQAGVVPTSDVLQDFGNFAAGMGKSITDLAQAAFNATTGEMEMLKQFGVVARQQGDQITVTFDGTTKTIERSGDAVIDFLRSIGAESFPTALAERLNTLSGAISNAKDASEAFQTAIGEGGVTDVLVDFNKRVADALNGSTDLAEAIGTVLAGALNVVLAPLLLVIENLRAFISILIGTSIGLIVINLGRIATAFSVIRTAVAGAFTATAAFMGLTTGPAVFGFLAIAGTAAATAYAILGDSADDLNEDLANQEELNKKVTDTVEVQKDAIGELTKEYQKFIDVVNKAQKREKDNLFNFPTEGITNLQQYNDLFDKFVIARTDAEERPSLEFMGQELFPKPLLRDLPALMSAGLFDEADALRGEFKAEFLKQFFPELTEQDIMDQFDIAVVGPVQKVLDLARKTLAEEDPLLMLKDLLQDPAALSGAFSQLGGMEVLGISEEDFAEGIRRYIKIAETELTPMQGLLQGVFDMGDISDMEKIDKAMLDDPDFLRNLYDDLMLLGEISEDMDFIAFSAQFNIGLDRMRESTEEIVDPLKALNDELDDLAGKFENQGQVLRLLNEAVASGVLNQDQANAAYREFLKSAGPTTELLVNIGEAVESTALAFADTLASALMQGQLSLQTFKDFASQIIQQIIAEFIRLKIIEPIVNAALGAMGLTTSGASGGTSATGDAGGGRLQARQVHLVGERGPELFVPDSGGVLLNNMNTRNAMGGGGTTIVQNLNFSTGVVPTVRSEILRLMPDIAEVTKGAVAEASARGGNYRRSLLGGT